MAHTFTSKILKPNAEHTWPVWATLGIYLATAAATTAISYYWYLGGITAGIGLFLTLTSCQFIAVALLGSTVWRYRHSFTVLAQAIFLSGIVSLSWWSVAQPVFTTLVVFFDSVQLAMLSLAWIFLVPIWGTVMTGAFTYAVFRPFLYLKDPYKIHRYSIQYPRIIAIGFFIVVTVAYVVGPLLIRIFTNLPLIEFYKFLILGMVSVLFISLAFFFAHDTLVRPIRKKAQSQMGKLPPVRQVYAWRVFLSSIVISLGAVLFTGTVVFRLYQDVARENVQLILSERLAQAEYDLTTNTNTNIADQAQNLKISQHTTILSNPNADTLLAYSPETATALSAGQTVVINRQEETSVIGILQHPANGQALLVEVPVSDFYTLLRSGVPVYIFASILVLAFSVAISGYFSFALARTLRALSSAVRQARDSTVPFTFSTYTGDELEELSHAFQYYITEANELRAHLEDKVKQRTQELLRVEEEKRRLEVAAAQQETKFEHQRRELAEDAAQQMEEKVQERTAALRDAIRHLEESDRVKSEFISLASHQLRTPLTSLRWAHHALLEGSAGKLNTDQKKVVQTSLDRTLFMLGLVNELLDVTRIEDQEYDLKRVDTPMRTLLEKIVEEFKETADHKHIALTFKAPKTLPSLFIDSNKIKMAVSNIVDNAIKYTPPEGSVVVNAKKTAKDIVIEVSDTGVGIPKEDAYRVFSKFFRAKNAIAMHTNGSGLGLYIAKTIIEKHGGTIALESEPNKKTTVTLTIPIKQREPGELEEESQLKESKLGALNSLIDSDEEQS